MQEHITVTAKGALAAPFPLETTHICARTSRRIRAFLTHAADGLVETEGNDAITHFRPRVYAGMALLNGSPGRTAHAKMN